MRSKSGQRTKSGVLTFVLGPGDKDYRTWWLKLSQIVDIGMFKARYEYTSHTKNKLQGQGQVTKVHNM